MSGKNEVTEINGASSVLVSVITVVYNDVRNIEETMLSVLPFVGKDLEYIVIDGGSKDGTADVIRKHEKFLAKWVSEPDKGIYDALNKGVAASNGFFVYTLNVGDQLVKPPFRELEEERRKNTDVVMFSVLQSTGKVFQSSIGVKMRFANSIHHQGVFYKRTPEISYDLAYRIYADFDLNQRLYKAKKHFSVYTDVVSTHRLDGVSVNRKHFAEYYSIIRKNFGYFFFLVGWMNLEIRVVKAKVVKLVRRTFGMSPGNEIF